MNRRLKLSVGGILGAFVGLAAWFGIGYGIYRLVSHYYPAGGGMGLSSDEAMTAAGLALVVLPIAGLAGAWVGVKAARRMCSFNDGGRGSSSRLEEE